MGPAPRLPVSVETNNCRTILKNVSHIVARCQEPLESEGQFTDIVFPRERSATPPWMVEHMRSAQGGRQMCNQCTPPPIWQTENVIQKKPMLAGPEVSYGIPFRWSGSRMLAGDLWRTLSSLDLITQVNHSAWTLDEFIKRFTASSDSSEGLFKQPGTAPPPPSLLEEVIASKSRDGGENELWNGSAAGWVGCNKYNGTCYGVVSKNDWYGPTRGEVCLAAYTETVRAGSVNSSVFGIDICNLNARLNSLCLALKEAQKKVFEANCIYTGSCSIQSFVYTPGMYSSTNEDFVRGTVTNFYELYNMKPALSLAKTSKLSSFTTFENENLVCPMDTEQLAMRFRNEALTNMCASVQLERVQDALRIARTVVHLIVNVQFAIINMVLALLRLLIPSSLGVQPDEVVKEIQYWFTELVILLSESLKEIGNLFFRMLFDSGGFGTVMKQLMQAVCYLLNLILIVWNYTGCVVFKGFVLPLMEALVNILAAIIQLFSSDSGIITLLNSLIRYGRDVTCDTSIQCQFLHSDVLDLPDGALPVASRCWTDYTPGVDDSDSFACSRSDTCRVSTLLYGTDSKYGSLTDDGRQIVCDACPKQEGGLTNQFGCDTYTRQCTCNRLKRDRTSCTSNGECSITGGSSGDTSSSSPMCALVNDFSTGRSYGVSECLVSFK